MTAMAIRVPFMTGRATGSRVRSAAGIAVLLASAAAFAIAGATVAAAADATPSKPAAISKDKTSGQNGASKTAKTSEWQSQTDVTPDADAAGAQLPADSPCLPLYRNVQSRITHIRALRAQTEKANAAPPPTVSGTLQKWLGDKYVSPAATKNTRKISEAWNAAEEINAMLVAAKCPAVDIEREVTKAAGTASDSPIEAPTSAPPQIIDGKDRTIFDEPAQQ